MTKDRILAELEQGGKTTKALIAKLGGSYASIHTSLKRMKDRGLVAEVTQFGNLTLAEPTWYLTVKIAEALSLGKQVKQPAPKSYAGAQAQAQAQQPARKLRTKYILVVDDSGSMDSWRYEMQKSINDTLGDLRSQAFRTGQQIDVSLYYFGNYRVRPAFLNVDARDVKNEEVRRPDGGTPLFSAVEDAINQHLQPERADEDVAYVVLTITDGQDNQSRDQSGNTMKELVRRVQGTDRWTITFQMPPGTKNAFCHKYSIHPGNCMEWEQSVKGFERATVARATSVSNYLSNRSMGVHSMDTFYTDLSGVDAKDLQKNLDNIAGKVKTWTVPAEVEIRPFVEARTGLPYQAGEAFYQLTKSEELQAGKKVLIKEKGGRGMFAGDQARTLAGLPVGQKCRVKPGNHANFDLFVESNSVNRKLVRGTTVVHWPLSLQ